MKLTKVHIRNYRSIFGDDWLTVLLSEGMNALVGPNNCGKSNILRAVGMALDPDFPFDRTVDLPGPLQWAFPKVVLEFSCEAKYGPEKTLLKYVADYERSAAKGKKTFADEGKLLYQVQYSGSESSGARRQEWFQARAGARRGDPELLEKALRQFGKALRLVTIESGQSLESVLEGKFREILHSVVRENLKDEFAAAEGHRQDYTQGLGDQLLGPLRERMGEVLSELFPEMSDVNLVPSVSSIDQTLSEVAVHLRDAVETPLAAKGTGVRGGVMVAMLRYLAENSRRSMIFCVEEPEAFLHPGAQEELRDDLEALAERSDVTLLITTHSPFVISRDPKASVIAITKNGHGQTLSTGSAAGDEPRASLLGDLFRDAALPDLMERVDRLPEDALAFLIVEGDTDEGFLRIAATKAKRKDLLDGIAIIPSGGADKLVTQALLTKQLTDRPILTLLDYDEIGKDAANRLAKLGFQNKKEILSYRAVFKGSGDLTGLEAEDLWPDHLHESFVAKHGKDVLAEQKRIGKDGIWHYGYTKAGKELIGDYLKKSVKQSDTDRWVELMKMVRELLEIDAPESQPEAGLPGSRSPDEKRTEVRVAATTANDTVIVPARFAYGEYLDHGIYVCQAGRFFAEGVARMGFYADAAIQTEIPRIRHRRDGVTFSREEVERLRASEDPVDHEIGALVEKLLAHAEETGGRFQVFLLTAPDDPDTLRLGRPIQNTKRSLRGNATAWTQKQRYVSSAHLARNPSTTDELDALSRTE